jgi:molybdopterin converting factor subunit 1
MIMQLNILLFGITREIVGQQKLSISMPEESSVPQLLEKLQSEYPQLKELQSLMVAVNNEYGQAQQVLKESDEIALIPPVSGG